jgi:hypothetical protein
MNQRKQRIAIAESDGWTDIRMLSVMLVGAQPNGHDPVKLPDYHGDMNAIQTVVRKIETKSYRGFTFVDELETIILREAGLTRHEMSARPGLFRLLMATPAQWCEAYLKTMDLWEDDRQTMKTESNFNAGTVINQINT